MVTEKGARGSFRCGAGRVWVREEGGDGCCVLGYSVFATVSVCLYCAYEGKGVVVRSVKGVGVGAY